MASELKVQTEIKKSVVKDGGYALKLSNRFTIGVPDLGIWLPPFAPFMAEVKDLGEVTRDFHLQLGVTPKQTDTMIRMTGGYKKPVAGLLVHAIHEGFHKLFVLPHDETRIKALNFPTHAIRQSGGYYNIAGLLTALGAPRI